MLHVTFYYKDFFDFFKGNFAQIRTPLPPPGMGSVRRGNALLKHGGGRGKSARGGAEGSFYLKEMRYFSTKFSYTIYINFCFIVKSDEFFRKNRGRALAPHRRIRYTITAGPQREALPFEKRKE